MEIAPAISFELHHDSGSYIMGYTGMGRNKPIEWPTWSLTLEYIANILYALFIRHFSKTLLAIFVIATGFLTIDLTMNLDVFNIFSANRNAAYTVIGGWSITPAQIYIGIKSVTLPILHGLLLSRINKLIKIKRRILVD